MADLGDDPNFYEDILLPLGCDLVWGFSLEPWDQTGGSAAFILNGVSYTMTVTVSFDGDDPQSAFQVHLTPTQLATAGAAAGVVFSYVVRGTMSDGSIQPLGYGELVFT